MSIAGIDSDKVCDSRRRKTQEQYRGRKSETMTVDHEDEDAGQELSGFPSVGFHYAPVVTVIAELD